MISIKLEGRRPLAIRGVGAAGWEGRVGVGRLGRLCGVGDGRLFVMGAERND